MQRSAGASAAPLELLVQRRDLRGDDGIGMFADGDALITCGMNGLPDQGNMPHLYGLKS